MSEILTPIEPQEDNNNNTNMLPSYLQHSIQLHSAMYQLLHTAVPMIPAEDPVPVSLITNGLGNLPVVAEDGIYIIKN